MDNFHDKPGHLIRRARPISTALFAEECAGFDLTSMQHAALAATKADPEVDATRLSALIAFDRPEFPPPPRTLPSRRLKTRSTLTTPTR
jgi:MarR family transcriptional regulator, lower aerobic nicotinate degradation pathway regulator